MVKAYLVLLESFWSYFLLLAAKGSVVDVEHVMVL